MIRFLKTMNRICVAFSRAKRGFYCIGNFDMFGGEHWSNIKELARKQNVIGTKLALTCKMHKKKHTNFDTTNVDTLNQFNLRPDWGCDLDCNSRLLCGHTCPRKCHTNDINHLKYKCEKSCGKIMALCNHSCQKQCSHAGECNQCSVLVEKKVNFCRHNVNIR